MHDAPQHEMCVHRERSMNEYVIPTQAPKKEMPAIMSMKTSEPVRSDAIFVPLFIRFTTSLRKRGGVCDADPSRSLRSR